MAQLKIENGPGKFGFMTALFVDVPSLTIDLTVVSDAQKNVLHDDLTMLLLDLYYEPKKEAFILQSVGKGADGPDDWNIEVVDARVNVILKGRYSTKTRKGFLVVG